MVTGAKDTARMESDVNLGINNRNVARRIFARLLNNI